MTVRLAIMGLAAALLVAGCTTSDPEFSKQVFTSEYGAVRDGGYNIPAVPISRVNSRYHRQIVTYFTRKKPGTIIVSTRKRYLYYVLPRNRVVRYGIGVGRAGFAWAGEAYVAWHPPKKMIARQPELRRYADGGQAPGLRNPLGACCTVRRSGIPSAPLPPPAASG